MLRKLLLFVMVLLLVLLPALQYDNVLAIQETQKKVILFVCQKPEFVCEALIEFVLSKKLLGYAVQIEVQPELFSQPNNFREWLEKQKYFMAYAIGKLSFFETQSVASLSAVDLVKWDAPYWWPSHDFPDVYEKLKVPNSSPKILARLDVSFVEELTALLAVDDVISESIGGVVTATNIVNSQNSKKFPRYQYNNTDNYQGIKTLTKLLKNVEFLVEKRGENALSSDSEEKQLNTDNFVESINKSNIGILNSTADQISEVYFEEKDWLLPVAKIRPNSLGTSYLEGNKIFESEYWKGEGVKSNNRIILLQNFYSSGEDLKSLLQKTRCMVSLIPEWSEFDGEQTEWAAFQYRILSLFLKGEVLIDAISKTVMEYENHFKTEVVIWGDPLITIQDLTVNNKTEKIDLGFSRSFEFSSQPDDVIEFGELPSDLKFETKNKKYIFSCATPVTIFVPGWCAIVNKYFLFEFRRNGERGRMFLKLKIFNFGGLKNPLFYLLIFCFIGIIISSF